MPRLHHGEVGTAVTRTWLASMLSHVVKSPLDVEPPRFQRSTRNAVYLPQAPDFQGTYRRKCWLASSIGGVNIVVLYRLGPSLSFELEVKTAFRLAIIRYWEVMTSPAATMLHDVRVLDMFLRDMNELDSVLAGTTRNPKQKQLDVTGPSVAPSRSVDVASERQQVERVYTRTSTIVYPRKKKTQSWLRRKQELHSLRQQTQEMATHLAFLQLQQKRRRHQQGSTEFTNVLQTWKAVVLNEQRRLRAAQDENEFLKSPYLRLSNALRAAVAPVMFQMNSSILGSQPTMGPELLQISSTSTFTMLEARVDERFQGDQTIFDDLRQAPIMVDAVEVHIYDGDEEKGATMEYKCSQVLPFDNKATATVFWSIIGADSSMQQKQIVKRSENTSAAHSRFLLRFPVGRDDCRYSICDEALSYSAGCIMLAESSTKWSIQRENSTLWSHDSQESIRCVICRPPLSVDKQGCQMDLMVRSEAVQKRPSDQSPSPHYRGLPLYRDMIDSQRQLLENLMWDAVRSAEKC